MFQLPKHCLTVLAGAVVLTATAATPAAALPRGPAESAETKFVLFALEDLFSNTWPNAKSAEHAQPVRNFIARRDRVIHALADRVKEAKLGGMHNEKLLETLELYMKFVRERGEKHATELDNCAEPLNRKYLDIFAKANRAAAEESLNAASRVLSTTSSYMSRGDADPLVGLFGFLIVR
ncbi:MAG: hypothetical protein ACRELG_12990, partial [Gemmataceae bacterium]